MVKPHDKEKYINIIINKLICLEYSHKNNNDKHHYYKFKCTLCEKITIKRLTTVRRTTNNCRCLNGHYKRKPTQKLTIKTFTKERVLKRTRGKKDITYNKVIELYKQNTYTKLQIAQMLDLSYSVIWKHINNYKKVVL